jgi:hypothetical protein
VDEELEEGPPSDGPELLLACRRSLVEQVKLDPLRDVDALPVRGERRQVVRVEAGDCRPRDVGHGPIRVGPHLILRNEKTEDAVPFHRGPEARRERPQVLTDDPGPHTVGFDLEDGVVLL